MSQQSESTKEIARKAFEAGMHWEACPNGTIINTETHEATPITNFELWWKSINPPEDKPKRSKEEILSEVTHLHIELIMDGTIEYFSILDVCKAMEEYASQFKDSGIELPSEMESEKKLVEMADKNKINFFYPSDYALAWRNCFDWLRDRIKSQMK
jgi:hypothetical protein